MGQQAHQLNLKNKYIDVVMEALHSIENRDLSFYEASYQKNNMMYF